MTFLQKLQKAIAKNNSLLCIGLDPDPSKFPQGVNDIFQFNKAIIDATADLVCAYKPNSAFYEALGDKGIKALQKTIEYIHHRYTCIPVILDAKRGDIDSTNNGYVTFAFEFLGADAITLHPYLGQEALAPFLTREDKGCIILCKTSNKGSGEFQDLQTNGKPLYLRVASRVAKIWNTKNNCLLVVGATYPEQLKEVRKVAPGLFLLIPGVGAQGGDLEVTLKNGLRGDKSGLIICASRSIIFAKSARKEAEKLQQAINTYR